MQGLRSTGSVRRGKKIELTTEGLGKFWKTVVALGQIFGRAMISCSIFKGA